MMQIHFSSSKKMERAFLQKVVVQVAEIFCAKNRYVEIREMQQVFIRYPKLNFLFYNHYRRGMKQEILF